MSANRIDNHCSRARMGLLVLSAVMSLGITLLRDAAAQTPATPSIREAVRSVNQAVLDEYLGAYQWGPNAFVYLQLWNEFARETQLVAFDESGAIRTLYP